MRFLAVRFADWAVTAAGHSATEPVAIVEAGAVLVCSVAAFDEGVRVGQRRREAKRHSPLLVIESHDQYRNVQAFEPFVAALTQIVPRIEVTEPGLCTMACAGPSRYYGGEAALVDILLAAVAAVMPEGCGPPVGAGIADSRFAAELAAQHRTIVPAGATREFLAQFPISTLGLDDLTVLSRRLGISTLGQFAALPIKAVLSRFGMAAAAAHQLARGEQLQPLAISEVSEPLSVDTELDPPAERVDIATFAARSLAAELIELVTRRGLACTQLRIDAETEHGETLSRLWRASTVFDADTIIERVRWQLSGWLDPGGTDPTPTAGISLIRLCADETAGAADLQISLWGELSEADRRAIRGLDRVRGLLGPGGVFTAVLRGGRGPADRVTFVPWGEPQPKPELVKPWPGHVPQPSPTLVHPQLVPVEVIGPDSSAVQVNVRGLLNTSPFRIRLPDRRWHTITGWAGPWLIDEQWWEPESSRRQSRFQILTETAGAHLCLVRSNQWHLEATYD